MRNAESLQLGAIAALFLLWCATWLVLGAQLFGPTHLNWDQTFVAAMAAVAAARAAWRTNGPYRVFLAMLGVGLVLLAVSWASYVPTKDPTRDVTAVAGSSIAYAACMFVWICAWGYLALDRWQRRPPSALTGVVFLVVIIGLAAILTAFYYPEYRPLMGTNEGRLDAVTAMLEFMALMLGLACVLLGERTVVPWLLVSMAMLVASDMAFSENEVPAAFDALWQLGQFMMLATLLVFPRFAVHGLHEHSGAGERSGLSGVLLLLSLGSVLLLAGVGLVPVIAIWKAFFSVLFVVALVVAMVWLTDRFDDAVEYLEAFTGTLLQQREQDADWRDTPARLHTILQATGLGEYLDWLRKAVARLKQDVLFLGPERLYPPPKPAATDRPSCFIVMPFSLEWSNDVHRAIASACRTMSVQPVRGDDVFTPTDIVNDIWHSIHAASFVIADISGRNPNVMYELGIAHTLAKPVLIVSSNAGDIPIDLSTRRVTLYRQGGDWVADLEAKVTRSIAEMLNAYRLAPDSAAAPTAAAP
jgi:hypothetical protein